LQREFLFSMCNPIPFGPKLFLFLFLRWPLNAISSLGFRPITGLLPFLPPPAATTDPSYRRRAKHVVSPRLDISSSGTDAPLFPLPWPFDFEKLTSSKSTTDRQHCSPSTGHLASFPSYIGHPGEPPFFPNYIPLITFAQLCPTLHVHAHHRLPPLLIVAQPKSTAPLSSIQS
jgi:hypothetical protein